MNAAAAAAAAAADGDCMVVVHPMLCLTHVYPPHASKLLTEALVSNTSIVGILFSTAALAGLAHCVGPSHCSATPPLRTLTSTLDLRTEYISDMPMAKPMTCCISVYVAVAMSPLKTPESSLCHVLSKLQAVFCAAALCNTVVSPLNVQHAPFRR